MRECGRCASHNKLVINLKFHVAVGSFAYDIQALLVKGSFINVVQF